MAVEYQGRNFYFTTSPGVGSSLKEDGDDGEGNLALGSEDGSEAASSLHSRTESSIESGAGTGVELVRESHAEQANATGGEGQARPGSPSELVFTANFVHDLESIFWIYLWFIHSRIPSAFPHDSELLKKIRSSAKTFFAGGIDGNHPRRDLLTLPPQKDKLRALLDPLYSQAPLLLEPLNLVPSLAAEYHRIEQEEQEEQDGHRRFSYKVFKNHIHHHFMTVFKEIALSTVDDRIPVKTLEELLETQHASNPEGSRASGARAGQKRSGSEAGLDGVELQLEGPSGSRPQERGRKEARVGG